MVFFAMGTRTLSRSARSPSISNASSQLLLESCPESPTAVPHVALAKQATDYGGCISLLIIPAALLYAILYLVQLYSAPKLTTNDIVWSNVGSPFPMVVSATQGPI